MLEPGSRNGESKTEPQTVYSEPRPAELEPKCSSEVLPGASRLSFSLAPHPSRILQVSGFICIAYQRVYFAINIGVGHHDFKKIRRLDKNLDVESVLIFSLCTQ